MWFYKNFFRNTTVTFHREIDILHPVRVAHTRETLAQKSSLI